MSNLAIITKQQVQIRQALIVRSMPLGLHEADVDDWIKTNSLDELTYETANDLLDYLGVLPVTRPSSQAHLPLKASRILVNKRKDNCVLCGEPVLAGLGLHVFHDSAWHTYHNTIEGVLDAFEGERGLLLDFHGQVWICYYSMIATTWIP